MIGLAEVAVGDELPVLTALITRENLVRYAGASGDFNPIHWNAAFAKSVGLPDVIAHGMYTLALTGRVITEWVGDAGAVLEFGARFTRPVVVSDADGATLVVAGKVTSRADNGHIGVDLSATVDGQTVLAKAKAVLAVAAAR